MEQYFATIFVDVRHKRSVILLFSLVVPDTLKQSKFTDHEVDVIKIVALEQLQKQRILKVTVALDLLEK